MTRRPSAPLFARAAPKPIPFPIQHVVIDWDRLVAKRPLALETVDAMPRYLLKPEILALLGAERDPQYRLIFPIVRQTVTRRVRKLVERVGGAPFNITAHTFRHSFAIHLLLHARPLKYVSQLLGHRSVDSAEIYTNVLTVDGSNFLDGVDFH